MSANEDFDLRVSAEKWNLMIDGHKVTVFVVVDESVHTQFPNFRDKANLVGKVNETFIVAVSSAATRDDCERAAVELLGAMDFKFDADNELHAKLHGEIADQILGCARWYGGER